MPPPDVMTIAVRVLGPVRVSRVDDPASTPLLTQPRRLAVLAWLLLARPRGLHARDSLVALLWPEADQATGRHALRNALHGLRQAIGDDGIVVAGEAQVGVNLERVTCDALAFEADVAAGRWLPAFERYGGALLEGFHVADAPDFERWLDGERRRLHDAALRAAANGIEALRAAGDAAAAIRAARRALAISPDDEPLLRRLMTMLANDGDLGTALREYDRFAEHTHAELGVAPSEETQRHARALRAAMRMLTPLPVVHTAPPPASLAPIPAHVSPGLPSAPPQSMARDSATRRLPDARTIATVALVGAMLLAAIGALAFRAGARDDRSAHLLAAAREQRPADRLDERVLDARYQSAASHREYIRLPEARREFRSLVADAPLYAPGWAGLSFTLFMSAGDEMPPAQAFPAAVAAARKALALDSTLVEPRRTLVAEAMYGRWDLDDARRLLDDALAHHPRDPELLSLLANWYRWRGDHEASIRLKREALAANPLSPRYANQVVFSLILARRCAEAAEFFRGLGEDYRANAASRLYTYRALKCLGRRDEAAAALRASLLEGGNARDSALAARLRPPLSPARRDAAIHAVFRGRLDAWTAARQHRWRSATEAAVAYAEMENADSTLAWLDSMYVERATLLHIVPFDQNFDFLARDPRFRAFIARLPWKPLTATRVAATPGAASRQRVPAPGGVR